MTRVVFVPGWEKRLDREIHNLLDDLAEDVLDTMQRNCPIDTGELLRDLDWERIGKVARIGAQRVPHAIFVEEGVGPHWIDPTDRQALYWEGAPHPVNAVFHPGMHGTHFMKDALLKERVF